MEDFSMQSQLSAIQECLRDIQSLLSNQRSVSKSTSQFNELLTIEECSELTGLSKSTIYKKVSARLIPHFKASKRVYFRRQEVLDWMMSNPRKTVAEIEAEANQFVTNP